VLLAGLALAAAACATSRFDALYGAGRYQEAVRVYRADTTLHHQEKALYRTGLMHALPGSPVYDPTLARTQLERLLTLFPKTGYRTEASRLISLLREVDRQREAASRTRDRAARLSARVDTLYRRLARVEDDLDQRRAHLQTLEALNERLQADLKAREDSLTRLRTELRKLKAIDLRSAHDSTSSDPHRPR
jgi:septal ring factor EnvC (AmiA/AmiB activator)